MSNRRNRTRNAFALESLENRTVLSHVTIGHALVHAPKVHAAAHVSKVTHAPVAKHHTAAVVSAKIDMSPDPSSSGKNDPSSPDTSSPDPKGLR
jgi:hypothetical protein